MLPHLNHLLQPPTTTDNTHIDKHLTITLSIVLHGNKLKEQPSLTPFASVTHFPTIVVLYTNSNNTTTTPQHNIETCYSIQHDTNKTHLNVATTTTRVSLYLVCFSFLFSLCFGSVWLLVMLFSYFKCHCVLIHVLVYIGYCFGYIGLL